MSLYSRHVLPNLVHCACSLRSVMRQREKVVPRARGQVLEVGLGSGLNLPYYDEDKVSKVWGLDPSSEMIGMAEKRAEAVRFDVEFIHSDVEEISLEDKSVDTVLVTYTLCTIADIETAVKQMARVLKPGGELLFCEHGLSPDAGVRRIQNCINPVWKRVGGGCHLNRDIPRLIEEGGFRVRDISEEYIPGWRPVSFNYWGTATLS